MDTENGTIAPASPALRRTPIYASHVAHKGRIVPFAGWEMPVQYTGIVDEHRAVREAAGMFDVCHMGELEMRGQYAAQVVDYLITNDLSRLQDGQALYTCACNAEGTILDDLIVYRAAHDRFMIVCNASNREKMVTVFRDAAENHCEFRDNSDATALIALQGPRAFDVLARAGAEAASLRDLKPFHFRDAVVANVRCTVARTGYTGEDGVEIFCPWDEAAALWDQLLELGRDIGVRPCGLGARDTLRQHHASHRSWPRLGGKVRKRRFCWARCIGSGAGRATQAQTHWFRSHGARDRAARLPAAQHRRRCGWHMYQWQPWPDCRQEYRPRLPSGGALHHRTKLLGRLQRQAH
jgi:glycine cleavage system aminomethyltransferase T